MWVASYSTLGKPEKKFKDKEKEKEKEKGKLTELSISQLKQVESRTISWYSFNLK